MPSSCPCAALGRIGPIIRLLESDFSGRRNRTDLNGFQVFLKFFRVTSRIHFGKRRCLDEIAKERRPPDAFVIAAPKPGPKPSYHKHSNPPFITNKHWTFLPGSAPPAGLKVQIEKRSALLSDDGLHLRDTITRPAKVPGMYAGKDKCLRMNVTALLAEGHFYRVGEEVDQAAEMAYVTCCLPSRARLWPATGMVSSRLLGAVSSRLSVSSPRGCFASALWPSHGSFH